jgi:hypothetical protein
VLLPPEGPGLGVELVREAVEEFASVAAGIA